MKSLQTLLADAAPDPAAWLVIFDDDVTFVHPHRSRIIDYAAEAHLDLAMPAHWPSSPHTFNHTVLRPASTVRRVRFVEVGPLLLVSPDARQSILPFPADAQMGWGLDVHWATLAARGKITLGVIDTTPVIHHGPVGAAYPRGGEEQVLNHYLREAGIGSAYELVGSLTPRWHAWQRTPPWTR